MIMPRTVWDTLAAVSCDARPLPPTLLASARVAVVLETPAVDATAETGIPMSRRRPSRSMVASSRLILLLVRICEQRSWVPWCAAHEVPHGQSIASLSKSWPSDETKAPPGAIPTTLHHLASSRNTRFRAGVVALNPPTIIRGHCQRSAALIIACDWHAPAHWPVLHGLVVNR